MARHKRCAARSDAAVIDLGSVESSNAIFVSVSGSGNPIPHLLALAAANDWVVMDMGTSEFLSEDDVESAGWEGYQKLLGTLRRDHLPEE